MIREKSSIESTESRLTVVPIIATLALRCASTRLGEAGLTLNGAELGVVRDIAFNAFRDLVSDAERLEEIDYSLDHMGAIWLEFFDRLEASLEPRSFAHLAFWIGEYQEFLLGLRGNIALKLLRIRADPTYLEELSSVLRSRLIVATGERLIPIVSRNIAVSRDPRDEFIKSFWGNEGAPTTSINRFAANSVAQQILQEVHAQASNSVRKELCVFASDEGKKIN